MAHWIHLLLQTVALISGSASLLVVRPRGRRKEAWRSLQIAFSEAALQDRRFTEDPRRYVEFIRQSRVETQRGCGFLHCELKSIRPTISRVAKSLIKKEES